MQFLSFGSLNIDRVFEVDHVVRPGETIGSNSMRVFGGGKGANQSVALARAGARVMHAGKVGSDGQWLIDKLSAEGIDTHAIDEVEGPTGQALIQVDKFGQNSIVLLPGANHQITRKDIDRVLDQCERGTMVLLQNEISEVGYLIGAAADCGLRVCLNPAPFRSQLLKYPLDRLDLLFLNETEAAGMTGRAETQAMIQALTELLPECEVILTVGDRGAVYSGAEGLIATPAAVVDAVDTTAAGDTFLGYYLAQRAKGVDVRRSMTIAHRAAAICVSRPGAIESIPTWAEVESLTAASA